MKYNSVTLGGGTVGTDTELVSPEKPRIHYVHDVGQTGSWLQDAASIPQDTAESFGTRTYKEAQFTRTYNFWIKPLEKTNAQNTTDSWNSYSKWVSTNGVTTDMIIPENNLYFGFTKVPTGFQYKTVIHYYLEFKDLYFQV